MKKKIFLIVIVLIGIVLVVIKVKRITPLTWEHDEINQSAFSDHAINGYDVIAYHTDNKAVLGKEEFALTWKNSEWLFSTEENKNTFTEYPEQYAPRFGGFCSFAVSNGFTANTDPNVFEVIDGKLYLFSDEDMRKNWKKNQDANLKKCETNWK